LAEFLLWEFKFYNAIKFLVMSNLLCYVSLQVSVVECSGASILNQRVKKRTGFGLVLNQTKSHLVFSNRNQTKTKPLYFFNIKTKPKTNKLIFPH
jgi:hypothetical protein